MSRRSLFTALEARGDPEEINTILKDNPHYHMHNLDNMHSRFTCFHIAVRARYSEVKLKTIIRMLATACPKKIYQKDMANRLFWELAKGKRLQGILENIVSKTGTLKILYVAKYTPETVVSRVSENVLRYICEFI
jgi:hypothetical protein